MNFKVYNHVKNIDDYIKFLRIGYKFMTLYRGQKIDKPLLPKLGRLALNNKAKTLNVEQEMLRQFREQSIPFLNNTPNRLIDWVALAQHHGLPTRLLDWTSNPLIALWFAVESPSKSEGAAVVWRFDTEADDFADENFDLEFGRERAQKTTILRPPHIASRIKAQCGYFTAHVPQSSDGSYVAFEDDEKYSKRLSKIMIDPKYLWRFRYDLDILGINRAFIYSDLDGLAQHITWWHTLLDDEIGVDPEKDLYYE